MCQNHHINESTLEEAYRQVIKETMKDSATIMQSLEQMIKDEMNPRSAEQIENIEDRILSVQEQVLTLRKSKQSSSISQTDYDEQIKLLGSRMKALEEEKESMTKDTSDYQKASMWLKDFNEHIKEGNILTDGDQYIMKKLLKEIVVESRKTVNFIFKCGIEKRISL